MPVGASGPGFIAPYQIVPMTGPTGVLPATRIGGQGGVLPPRSLAVTGIMPPAEALPDRGLPAFSNLATVVRDRIRARVFPPVGMGEGFISQSRRTTNALDLINGMDQTLGKRQSLSLGARRQQTQKIYGTLSTREALGPMTGRLQRMYM